MTIAMKRAGTEIKISMKTGFVETESGEPVSMFQKLEFGGAPAVSSYEWRGDEVVSTIVKFAKFSQDVSKMEAMKFIVSGGGLGSSGGLPVKVVR